MELQDVTQRIFQVRRSSALTLELEGFLLDCRSRNLAVGTLRFYEQKLRPMLAWLEQHGITSPDEIKPLHIRAWIVELADGAHSAGGVHAYYRAAKAFCSWLEAEGSVETSPMKRVRGPKLPEEPLEPVSIEHVRAMLRTCDGEHLLDLRDAAILLALLDTGCRATELTALTYGEANLKTGALLIRSGKGRKPRMVYLGVTSRRAVLKYLRKRGQPQDGEPLSAISQGTQFTYFGLRSVIERRAGQAGIEVGSTLVGVMMEASGQTLICEDEGCIQVSQAIRTSGPLGNVKACALLVTYGADSPNSAGESPIAWTFRQSTDSLREEQSPTGDHPCWGRMLQCDQSIVAHLDHELPADRERVSSYRISRPRTASGAA